MNVGDLVSRKRFFGAVIDFGVIVEIVDVDIIPALCKVMWSSGEKIEEYADEIEVVNSVT